jgi:hypothetical protein
MHIVNSDTLTFGVAWLDKQLYGEGGLQIHFGKRILCFWKRPKPFCTHCCNDGYNCSYCDTEYRDE